MVCLGIFSLFGFSAIVKAFKKKRSKNNKKTSENKQIVSVENDVLFVKNEQVLTLKNEENQTKNNEEFLQNLNQTEFDENEHEKETLIEKTTLENITEIIFTESKNINEIGNENINENIIKINQKQNIQTFNVNAFEFVPVVQPPVIQKSFKQDKRKKQKKHSGKSSLINNPPSNLSLGDFIDQQLLNSTKPSIPVKKTTEKPKDTKVIKKCIYGTVCTNKLKCPYSHPTLYCKYKLLLLFTN